MVPDTFLIIPLKILVLLILYVKLDFSMVITLLMKILFIICHVPSSLFSYFLFVFVLFCTYTGVFINHNNNNNNNMLYIING